VGYRLEIEVLASMLQRSLLQIVFYSIELTSCLSIGGDPDSVRTATAGRIRGRGGNGSLSVVVEGLMSMARMMSSTGNCCHRRSDSKISCLHLCSVLSWPRSRSQLRVIAFFFGFFGGYLLLIFRRCSLFIKRTPAEGVKR